MENISEKIILDASFIEERKQEMNCKNTENTENLQEYELNKLYFNNSSIKDQYKRELERFAPNLKRLIESNDYLKHIEKPQEFSKNKIVFGSDYPKKLRNFIEIGKKQREKSSEDEMKILEELLKLPLNLDKLLSN